MVVEIKNLVKKYGKRVILNDLNLSIAEGEVYGFLGPNGAGKTTTINSIIGITKIESGNINIFGKDMKSHKNEIKKNIGVVPQNIALFTEFSAYENVKFFGKLYGLKGQELEQSIKDALDFVDLWDRRGDRPGKYSGGMQRRLNIACAIVHKPKLIIMDEPTVGIDPQSRNHIMESIKRLNEMGSTIIYTSHYMEEVELLCDKVAIIDKGHVIVDGTKEEVKDYIKDDKVMEVTFESAVSGVEQAIADVSGVKSCSMEDGVLRIVITKECSDLSQILSTLGNCNAVVSHINVKEKSLEDIFLSITGSSNRD